MSVDNDPNSKRDLLQNVVTGRGSFSSSPISDQSSQRRSFMKRLGITIGAVPLGAGSLAGGTAAEDAADSDIDVSVTELTGLQRDRLVWEALCPTVSLPRCVSSSRSRM